MGRRNPVFWPKVFCRRDDANTLASATRGSSRLQHTWVVPFDGANIDECFYIQSHTLVAAMDGYSRYMTSAGYSELELDSTEKMLVRAFADAWKSRYGGDDIGAWYSRAIRINEIEVHLTV